MALVTLRGRRLILLPLTLLPLNIGNVHENDQIWGKMIGYQKVSGLQGGDS